MVNVAFVILASNVVAFVVIICCFILHLKNHFQLKLSEKKNSKETTNTSSSKNSQRHIFCCLYSLNGYIEFYPLSTLLYFYCSIIIVLFLIVFIISDTENYYNNPQLSEFCPLKKNIIRIINNPSSITSILIFKKYDFICYYFVLILLLWETLFNFYRFYDALFMAKYLANPSKTKIFSFYIIYFIIFCAVYLIQINSYFLFCIITIFIHFTFNAYCIHGFIMVLHSQYEHISNVSSNCKLATDYLQIINRTKKYSFSTLLISTLYLLITTGCYTNYISIILLPIYWMILSICFTLNFVKNRLWLNLKCKTNCTYHSERNKTKTEAKLTNQTNVSQKPNIEKNISIEKKVHCDIKININDHDINDIEKPELNNNQSLETLPENITPQFGRTSIPSQISLPSQELRIDITPPVSNDNINVNQITKAKAFDLLCDMNVNVQNAYHKPVYSNSLTPVPMPTKLVLPQRRSYSENEVSLNKKIKNVESTILIDMLVNQGFYPHTFVK